MKAHRKILFSKEDILLQPLQQALTRLNHRAIVLWTLEAGQKSMKAFSSPVSQDPRPQDALDSARAWAEGRIKMPLARQAILSCHRMAREVPSLADQALCHAIGQAASAVHTPGHAMGYPTYALTAQVLKLGLEDCQAELEQQTDDLLAQLLYWAGNEPQYPGPWSFFLRREIG